MKLSVIGDVSRAANALQPKCYIQH